MVRVISVGLLALLSLSATPQQSSIIWAKSWAEAVKEATARNVPLVFTIHKDG